MITTDERMWTIDQIAEVTNVHPATIRRAIDAKKLTAYYVGAQLRIRDSDLTEYLTSRRAARGAKLGSRRKKVPANE